MKRSVVALAVLAVWPLALPLWAAVAGGSQPGITMHELVGYLHLLLFVFWLGADVGVFICAHGAVQPGLTGEQRLRTAQLMSMIELAPRISASLMLTVGGLLGEYVGLDHPVWQLAGIVLLGPVWLTLVLASYYREGTAFGAQAARLDVAMRRLLMVAVPVSVAYAWSTGRLDAAPYVAWKLIIFAGLMGLGLGLRRALRPFDAGLRSLRANVADPGLECEMARAVARARWYAGAIWIGLAAAAFLGIAKPGVPPEPREPWPPSVLSSGASGESVTVR